MLLYACALLAFNVNNENTGQCMHVCRCTACDRLLALITPHRPYSMNDELHLFTFNRNRINGYYPYRGIGTYLKVGGGGAEVNLIKWAWSFTCHDHDVYTTYTGERMAI